MQFRRSKSFGPIRLNLSKSGIGMSTGIKGLRVGVNSKGQTYGSANIPGTGLTYRSNLGGTNNNNQSYNNQNLLNSLVTADILGFEYNTFKYRESDNKGCLKIFMWIVSICLIPAIIGIFTTIALIYFNYSKNKKPETKFLKNFSNGYLNASTGKFKLALTELNIAETYQPNNIDLIDLKGVCLFQTGDFENAKQYFLKAIQISQNPRFKALYTECLKKIDNKEDYPKLIALYEEFIQNEPDEETIFLLGYYNYMSENYEKGLSYLQKIPKESELYLKALQGMATCFYFKEQPKLAIEVLNRAPLRTKNLNEDLLSIHYALGNLYEENGDLELAKSMYQKVYLHDVNYKDVKEKLENIDK